MYQQVCNVIVVLPASDKPLKDCIDAGGALAWAEVDSGSSISPLTVAEATTLMPYVVLALGIAWGFRLLVNQLLNRR